MTCWVLIDESNGAQTQSGEPLTPAALAHIAEACRLQLNRDYAPEHGGAFRVRAGSGPTDIAPGERVYVFQPTLPEEGASAYHDTNGKGVEVAFCAVTTCATLLGPAGVGVDASHELLETSRDPGCNQLADDLAGTLHAIEVGDPVEVQDYPVTCKDGTIVCVSNFVLPAWLMPGAPPPYDFMSSAAIAGAVPPPGPMQNLTGQRGQLPDHRALLAAVPGLRQAHDRGTPAQAR